MNRDCGECYACCYVLEIKEINKKPYCECPCLMMDKNEERCIIYDARPEDCSNFACAWLRDFGSLNDRPDKSGILASINAFNNGIWIFIIELKSNAVNTTGKDLVIQLVKSFDFPAIISSYGSKPPFDTGDLTVVKEELKYRARNMIGKLVNYLNEDNSIGIYKLIK